MAQIRDSSLSKDIASKEASKDASQKQDTMDDDSLFHYRAINKSPFLMQDKEGLKIRQKVKSAGMGVLKNI